jgi:hypothetical protein
MTSTERRGLSVVGFGFLSRFSVPCTCRSALRAIAVVVWISNAALPVLNSAGGGPREGVLAIAASSMSATLWCFVLVSSYLSTRVLHALGRRWGGSGTD